MCVEVVGVDDSLLANIFEASLVTSHMLGSLYLIDDIKKSILFFLV